MLRLLGLLSIASLILIGNALDVTGRIAWNAVCINYKALGQTRVKLDNGKYSANVAQDGVFTIPNVNPGTYVFSAMSHNYAFDQLRIDVYESAIEVRPYVPGTPLNPPSTITLQYPIELSAKQKYNYFVPPESFNVMGMLGSPMMLLMIFGGGMMLAMPYLMKNLDPEALEDMKEQQTKMAKMQNAMTSGDLKGGLSAFMSSFEEPPPSSQSVQKSTPGAKKKNTKKR
ncbi:hypothetical protein E1B28_001248 [Marasmius oreades]|uniref:ER membrane protein complex subunit 7 beta-sandwich domain-containing protein n=1 Tax=Marasmius oreades TaxID=181124 RepID=A0A9P7V325_9AGAR|nr:uncharacterized protein E1B28_001248 [Marasmius oreades]KAG7099395.1 hypothetical protein E1B28_001248 [Marasmius oreades]